MAHRGSVFNALRRHRQRDCAVLEKINESLQLKKHNLLLDTQDIETAKLLYIDTERFPCVKIKKDYPAVEQKVLATLGHSLLRHSLNKITARSFIDASNSLIAVPMKQVIKRFLRDEELTGISNVVIPKSQLTPSMQDNFDFITFLKLLGYLDLQAPDAITNRNFMDKAILSRLTKYIIK